MQRIFASAMALIGLVPLVPAASAASSCSLATLTGNYAASQSGFEAKDITGPLLPFAVVGVVAFDGNGDVSSTVTIMGPGKGGPGPYQPEPGVQVSGTYTVNSDCTGSIDFTSGDVPGLTYNLVIFAGGTEVFGIITVPFVAATVDLKKQ